MPYQLSVTIKLATPNNLKFPDNKFNNIIVTPAAESPTLKVKYPPLGIVTGLEFKSLTNKSSLKIQT